MSETATQLIATARNAGIMLWVERGALKFRAPAGTLTGELREAIRTNRDAVIAALQAGTTLTEDPTNQYEPFALTAPTKPAESPATPTWRWTWDRLIASGWSGPWTC